MRSITLLILAVNLPTYDTVTTTGTVNGYGYTATSSVSGMAPATTAPCTIQFAVDANGIIESFQLEGNELGCERYAHAWCH